MVDHCIGLLFQISEYCHQPVCVNVNILLKWISYENKAEIIELMEFLTQSPRFFVHMLLAVVFT